MFENENQEWVTHMEKQKSIQQMQAEVDQYIGQFKEGYFSPLAMLARMSEELGELAREVNHYHGEKPKKATEEENTIEAELGDMLFVLICFANSLGIDLQNSHDLVMEKFTTRDKDRWTRKEEEMEEEGKDE
ncbi:nucleotide pyrophosphohydrolase [Peribacillus castrilensis]|uniref:Nucleotide pyrophosphohydrolase n=2 Tax=Bacillaceae TaxID=186817 RepID=A0AAJ1QPF7_9BACI|nr:nucleotide pyrophosphohydrolase [Peribacillus frigoritolerans]MDM5285161.1 nucleotide pyrophosphohydrolase [Peribacillus frigoritolerans]